MMGGAVHNLICLTGKCFVCASHSCDPLPSRINFNVRRFAVIFALCGDPKVTALDNPPTPTPKTHNEGTG